jgi:hypothetical protein
MIKSPGSSEECATMSDPTELAKLHEAADDLLRPFNQCAPRYMEGETADGYRKRLAGRIQEHAPSMKEINLRESVGSVFNLIEKQIYEEARREAVRPTTIPDGEMREIRKYDATGRPFIEWHGSPKSWLGDFSNGAKRRLVGIRTETPEAIFLTAEDEGSAT